MKLDDFAKEINSKRKKGGWYSISLFINSKQVILKGYKTWLQIYRVDNLDYSNSMERTVKQFNEDLLLPFQSLEKPFQNNS